MTLKFTWGFNIHIWFPPLYNAESSNNMLFLAPQKIYLIQI